jgi:hypothetical protein
MPFTIKYNTVSESRALKKGNFYIGTGDVGKGPSSSTGFYNGINPPVNGYTVYVHKAVGGPNIYVASNDANLISITNSIASASYTTVAQCVTYYESQPDKMVVSKDIGNIVTDNISLCLLPQNVISFQNGLSSWYDVANGLVFTSSGTQTPFNNSNGFNFNGSGFWSCSTNANLVDLGGDCTVILWVYGLQGAVRKTIFEKAGTVASSYQQELAITWETSSAFSYYSRRTPDYDSGAMTSTTANVWNMMALKMSTGLTTAARTGFRSKNGGAWSANYTSRSNVALTPSGAIRIGTGYAGTCDSGGIGAVLCYNKMLDDAEILQVFNAMKGDYGL